MGMKAARPDKCLRTRLLFAMAGLDGTLKPSATKRSILRRKPLPEVVAYVLIRGDGCADLKAIVGGKWLRIAHAEDFVARLGIRIERGGEQAYYRPSTDTVHLPPFERFIDAQSEMSTRLHECAHATAAPHRLDRDLSGRFGSEAYAMEECIAELAASFVLADLGIACRPRPDHAAYLSSWLKVLSDDPRAIFTAASKAQAVADWMGAQQEPPL